MWTQCAQPVRYLSDTDIVRASKRQHPVQGSGSQGNLGRLGLVGANQDLPATETSEMAVRHVVVKSFGGLPRRVTLF
jgi:hypothetical protein